MGGGFRRSHEGRELSRSTVKEAWKWKKGEGRGGTRAPKSCTRPLQFASPRKNGLECSIISVPISLPAPPPSVRIISSNLIRLPFPARPPSAAALEPRERTHLSSCLPLPREGTSSGSGDQWCLLPPLELPPSLASLGSSLDLRPSSSSSSLPTLLLFRSGSSSSR